MEINEKQFKNILAEELGDFKESIDSKFKEQSDKFKRHVDSTMKEQRKEFQRYIGALKEDFDSKLNLIAGQHESIKDRLDQHSEMIGSMQENIEIMKADIILIKDSLERKVDINDFKVLEKRVLTLEAKVST